MAIEFMGAIGGVRQTWSVAADRVWSDTDITGTGGAELINFAFGQVSDVVAKPIDYGFFWTAQDPAAFWPMRTGAFDAFNRGGSQDVRYWMPKVIVSVQSTAPGAFRFWWANVKSTPESAAVSGDIALQITTDPSNNQSFIRVQWHNGTGWQNGTQTAAIADNAFLRFVVKVDLSGSDPIVTLYYGDGTAASMSSAGPDTMGAGVAPTIANVTSQTVPECTVGFNPAIAKNTGFSAGFFDYAVADATAGDSWNGYAWTDDGGGTVVEERPWERVPTGDGDDDNWTANGNAANCTGRFNCVDDEYHAATGDGANDFIGATDPAGGAAVQQLFTYQGLDGSDDPDGIAVVAVVRDHSKDADYSCHWKDSGGTERQKVMVKGYENGTNGTTLYCWLPTQAGTAGVSDWTHANVEAAQFGIQLDSDASADGRVYGYHILVSGDSFGAQNDVVVCPAPVGPRRRWHGGPY